MQRYQLKAEVKSKVHLYQLLHHMDEHLMPSSSMKKSRKQDVIWSLEQS